MDKFHEQQLNYLKRKIKNYSIQELKDELLHSDEQYLTLYDQFAKYRDVLRKQKQVVIRTQDSNELQKLFDLIY
jgi:hypothetical protein